MIEIFETSTQAGFAMPISWTDAVSAAAVRTIPATGGASALAAAAGAERVLAAAPVCTYTRTTDVFVLKGAFPGTSPWSPPI